jgi:hypothetical protein
MKITYLRVLGGLLNGFSDNVVFESLGILATLDNFFR